MRSCYSERSERRQELVSRILLSFYRLLPLVVLILVPLAYNGQSFDPEFPKTLIANSIALWLVVLFLATRDLRSFPPLIRGILFALFFLGGISLFRAINLDQGLSAYITLLRNGILCLVCADLARDRRWREEAFACLAFASLTISVLGILQYYGIRPNTYLVGGRWSSTIGNINFAAQFILVSGLPCSVWMALSLRGKNRLWALLYFILVAWYFILCRSRGAWLGGIAGAALAIFFIIRNRQTLGLYVPKLRPLTVISALSVLLILLVVFSFLPRPGLGTYEPIYKYFLSAFDPDAFVTNKIRVGIWTSGLELVRDNLWTGVGLGNVEGVFPLYRSIKERRLSGPSSSVRHMHNDFLQMAAEGGLPYLIVFLAFLFLVLRQSLRNFFSSDHTNIVVFAIACLSGIVGSLLHSNFSSNLYRPASSVCFWMLCGLAYGVGTQKVNEKPSRASLRRLWLIPLAFLALFWIRQLPAQIHIKFGHVLISRNRLVEAEKEFTTALGIDPRSDEAWFLKGRVDSKQKRYDACIGDYLKSLELAPNRDKTHLNLYLCAKSLPVLSLSTGELEGVNKRVEPQAMAREALKRAKVILSEEEIRRLLSR